MIYLESNWNIFNRFLIVVRRTKASDQILTIKYSDRTFWLLFLPLSVCEKPFLVDLVDQLSQPIKGLLWLNFNFRSID